MKNPFHMVCHEKSSRYFMPNELVVTVHMFGLVLQYQLMEKAREAKEARENYLQYLDTDAGEAVANTEEFECSICYAPTLPGDGLVLRGCLHQFCKYVCNVVMYVHVHRSDLRSI